MVKIAYILLCHKDPDAIIEQARRLTSVGDYIVIHFDGRAPRADFARIRAALADTPRVAFPAKRIKCGWGEWSLVEATLLSVETALTAFEDTTHVYMLSGDCMPIKSAEFIHHYLAERDVDHIENEDFFESDWIKTGLREERLIYWHVFNERRYKRLFYATLQVQRRLGLRRAIPADLQVRIGSQWWCLRRATIEAILRFCRDRRDVMRFFRRSWIPDETFFQTLVPHLVPQNEIVGRTLTFLMFTDYGMPVTFYNDHYDLLLGQDYLFARKISPDATALQQRLGALYAETERPFAVPNEGASLFAFLTQRGREGRRFAPRIWDSDGAGARDREILIVLCKKWHVAKRLVARVGQVTNLPVLGYLFNEERCALPDLGGIQSTMAKRHRHRRALMQMLFEYYETQKLVICVDPANLDLVQDICADAGGTRLLELRCDFSDDYLAGHAQRLGLAGAATPESHLARLLPTIRADIHYESDRLRAAELPHHLCLSQSDDLSQQAAALSTFLALSPETGHTIADTEGLFTD